MAIGTECQTDGAIFHTKIESDRLSVVVDFGKDLKLSEEEAGMLECNLHNALELVLKSYWNNNG